MAVELYRWRHSILHHFARHQNVTRLGIRPTDLVLDLGSGQDPQPRANILCDKFVADSGERACQSGLVIDRPFVLADATETPFPDGAFDFVYCSHLLEHMERPERLLNELQRIGRRGYIETPSKVYEKLWGWPFHRWFVTLEGNRLVLEAKSRVIFDDDLHRWFSAQIERKPVWEFFMSRLKDLGLLTALIWEGEISYEIHGEASPNAGAFARAQLDESHALGELAAIDMSLRSWSQKVKQALSRLARRRSDNRVNEVLGALICPHCRLRLVRTGEGWHCTSCRALYPVWNNIHVMAREASHSAARGVSAII